MLLCLNHGLMFLILLHLVSWIISHHSLGKILVKHRKDLLFDGLFCVNLVWMPFHHMWLWRLLRLFNYILLWLKPLLNIMIKSLILHVMLILFYNLLILIVLCLSLSLLRDCYNLIDWHTGDLLSGKLPLILNLWRTSFLFLRLVQMSDFFLFLIVWDITIR